MYIKYYLIGQKYLILPTQPGIYPICGKSKFLLKYARYNYTFNLVKYGQFTLFNYINNCNFSILSPHCNLFLRLQPQTGIFGGKNKKKPKRIVTPLYFIWNIYLLTRNSPPILEIYRKKLFAPKYLNNVIII